MTTIEHEGIRVDVPSDWRLPDTSDCEFHFDRWAPPRSSPCDFEGGVAFYASATFDPAHGSGARRTVENGLAIWSGYVFAGDFAVSAADRDRHLAQAILDSVREPGG